PHTVLDCLDARSSLDLESTVRGRAKDKLGIVDFDYRVVGFTPAPVSQFLLFLWILRIFHSDQRYSVALIVGEANSQLRSGIHQQLREILRIKTRRRFWNIGRTGFRLLPQQIDDDQNQ